MTATVLENNNFNNSQNKNLGLKRSNSNLSQDHERIVKTSPLGTNSSFDSAKDFLGKFFDFIKALIDRILALFRIKNNEDNPAGNMGLRNNQTAGDMDLKDIGRKIRRGGLDSEDGQDVLNILKNHVPADKLNKANIDKMSPVEAALALSELLPEDVKQELGADDNQIFESLAAQLHVGGVAEKIFEELTASGNYINKNKLMNQLQDMTAYLNSSYKDLDDDNAALALEKLKNGDSDFLDMIFNATGGMGFKDVKENIANVIKSAGVNEDKEIDIYMDLVLEKAPGIIDNTTGLPSEVATALHNHFSCNPDDAALCALRKGCMAIATDALRLREELGYKLEQSQQKTTVDMPGNDQFHESSEQEQKQTARLRMV